MPEPNVLTVAAVARLKGVSRQAVAAAVARGTLPAARQGGTVLIPRGAKLAAYLATAPRPGVSAGEPQ